jgi:hypothetical protein
VCTTYPAEPLLALFDPIVELARFGSCGCLPLDRRIDYPAICFGKLLQVGIAEIHI